MINSIHHALVRNLSPQSDFGRLLRNLGFKTNYFDQISESTFEMSKTTLVSNDT